MGLSPEGNKYGDGSISWSDRGHYSDRKWNSNNRKSDFDTRQHGLAPLNVLPRSGKRSPYRDLSTRCEGSPHRPLDSIQYIPSPTL